MSKKINMSLLKDANYVCIAKELWDDGKVKKHGYLIVNKYDIKANNIQNMAEAAKFCASQIFWGTYGGLFGEGWEIKVKVSDGFSDETYHLVSFINEDDETFDFKEIV